MVLVTRQLVPDTQVYITRTAGLHFDLIDRGGVLTCRYQITLVLRQRLWCVVT